MNIIGTLFVAFSLSMDAFAVSVTNGTCITKVKTKHCLSFGLYFGIFQGGMSLLGYILGRTFLDYLIFIETIDHWIAFGLLGYLGGSMFLNSFSKDKDGSCDSEEQILKFSNMISLAIATSIDALAVGFSFAAIKIEITLISLAIGLVSFAMSWVGVYLGEKVGRLFKSNAERFGGMILFVIGFKILIEHLFFT